MALLNCEWLTGKKIIMLEPRRIAAKSVAVRMAALLGEEVGNTIGYRIRFEKAVSKNTKLEVVTEGILTQMLLNNTGIEDVGLIIFDEFHERSIHADVALAFCIETQNILRPDLRLIIMSATLNTHTIANAIKAKCIESSGKIFPVNINYTGMADNKLLPELTANITLKAIRETKGDILVFLPGEAEIKKCADLLLKNTEDIKIYPLYGKLPFIQQQLAILPDKNKKRKIVLATSIAQTSLTIEGISTVVDTGYIRTQRFDPKSGLTRLETVSIAKDAATQRAGRAGRLGPGVCYRMWTAAWHEKLPDFSLPEILEADLSSLLLNVYGWGNKDIYKLFWLTPPPKSHVLQAKETLTEINAIQNNGITEHGKLIQLLPCNPRIAHMLISATAMQQKQLATDLAAILEEKDPLGNEAGIDINKRIEALRRYREQQNKTSSKFNRIEKIASDYRQLLKVEANNAIFDVYDTGILLANAFPDRIACARPGNNAQYQLANGKYAVAGHKDDLANEPWLAVANIDLRSGLGKIFMASPVNPKDLILLVKKKQMIKWDYKTGEINASENLCLGSITLQSKPLINPDRKQIVAAISSAIAGNGLQMLNFTDEFTQLQNRILSIKIWNNNNNLPDASTQWLIENNLLWLENYLQTVKNKDDLYAINLTEALTAFVGYEQMTILNKLAPPKIEVPSGSKIQIAYAANAEKPTLSVRLQEIFGMTETPKINNNQTGLIIHLLSPGYKPVQITSDLKNFWQNTYFEIKMELQRRYPKHAWPDDPLNAKAVSKGGIKK